MIPKIKIKKKKEIRTNDPIKKRKEKRNKKRCLRSRTIKKEKKFDDS